MNVKFKFEVICYHDRLSPVFKFPMLEAVLEETQFIPRKKDLLFIKWGTELHVEGDDRVKITQDWVRVKQVTIDLFNKTVVILIDSKTEIEYV